jgi:segregation and condensation protein A
MAATLAHIKSKMLLPAVPDDPEDEDEVELDPRAELVRRLLEYQKYKNAAERLAEHPVLGRDVFPRGMPAPNVDGPAPIAGLSLFKLLDAFQTVLSRATATIDHQIDFERFSITERINELSDLLRVHRRLPFDELFQQQRTRIELIITFLALLEMTRLRLTRLYQEGPLEVIIVELAVTEDGTEMSPEAEGGGFEASPRGEDSGESAPFEHEDDNALELEGSDESDPAEADETDEFESGSDGSEPGASDDDGDGDAPDIETER